MKLGENIQLVEEAVVRSYHINESTECNVMELEAKELLNLNRLDLIPKIEYVKSFLENEITEEEIKKYLSHIYCMTNGTFEEQGSISKKNKDQFIFEFNNLIQSITENGFDSTKSIIPVGKDNVILNGAHRVAICIALNLKVKIVEFKNIEYKVDYRFLLSRGMDRRDLDSIVLKYMEKRKNTRVICVWPTIFKEKSYYKLLQEKVRIVYEKEIKLNQLGGMNFLHQIYYNDLWVGDYKSDYAGAYGKYKSCFPSEYMKVLVIEGELNNEEYISLKTNIRELYSFGKHSLHITDDFNESIEIAQIALNDNSISFINSANVTKFKSAYKNILEFKKQLKEKNIDPNSIIIDGGIILALHGIRNSPDLDYLSLESVELDLFDNHDKVLKYYNQDKYKLINDSQNYFHYLNLKFITLDVLVDFKKSRQESKDKEDLELIKIFLDSRGRKGEKIREIYIKVKRETRMNIIKTITFITRKTGTYYFVKKVKDSMIKR